MKIYYRFVLAVIAMSSLHLQAIGQEIGEMELYAQTIWSMKKKKMVIEFLKLNEGDKSAFWPLYEQYEGTIKALEVENLYIINVCSNNAIDATPQDLERYSRRLLQNDLLLARFRKQFYDKFKRALTPVVARQFMQFDETFRMMMRLEAQENPNGIGIVEAKNTAYNDATLVKK